MDRYLIAAHGVDDDAVLQGFRWLVAYARDHGHSRCGIAVPGLSNAEALSRPLGDLGAQLHKQRRVQASGLTFELLIERKQPFSYPGPVLAVWIDDKTMEKVERMSPPAVCAVPWISTDLDAWRAAWSPGDPRAGTPGGGPAIISNPVVEAAMRSLTARVNLGTGLGHPLDRSAAVWMLRLLKRAREDYDPGNPGVGGVSPLATRPCARTDRRGPEDPRWPGSTSRKPRLGRRHRRSVARGGLGEDLSSAGTPRRRS